MKIKTYRKKPVVIEAIHFDGSSKDWFIIKDWVKENNYKTQMYFIESDIGVIQIKTLEGLMTANAGDYIIKGIKGEFYPCHKDIFEASYESVEN